MVGKHVQSLFLLCHFIALWWNMHVNCGFRLGIIHFLVLCELNVPHGSVSDIWDSEVSELFTECWLAVQLSIPFASERSQRKIIDWSGQFENWALNLTFNLLCIKTTHDPLIFSKAVNWKVLLAFQFELGVCMQRSQKLDVWKDSKNEFTKMQ